MFQFLTNASVQLVNRYLPSPFVFSIVLTFIALITGIALTGQNVLVMAGHWGEGLWSLHSFAMQMALILVTGYAFANAPIIQRFLDNMASKVTSPTTAIMVSTLVGLAGSWINWGFGLVVGAIFAKSLARKVANVDYPLLVAAAYSGFVIWHGGFSGSIPLTLSSGGENLVTLSGGALTEAIPLAETVFAPFNLIILFALIVVLPIVNRLMHPKNPTTVDPAIIKVEAYTVPDKNTPAQKLDDSRIVALALFAFGVLYYINYFSANGFNLGLNIVIGLFLFIGLMAHGTLERYFRAVESGIGGITGIVLLFPFYGGIMGIMTGANADGISISSQVTEFFINNASADSFPIFAFLSAGLVNVFVPSGGGQFAVQGPVMMPAGLALGVSPNVTGMAIAWGDAWTNMIQPFWALPLLGIAGLDARAIMGYCLIILAVSGAIITGGFWLLV
ncbi:short-chain fatty acid transporter [Psychrobacter sp. FDAARGOS_221]|uniref:short-chain fatty acid transporter n=1 Tax=Psychrobacter sp. FDAARGOS_221 TaxID=1975705 RepID=UPI000BB56564|nr:TIGR00366 family protein [Psychrobacter sp. FDAARGOS_221]PNK60053.1 short-chain fatty acid transporter [Psychrobacter sp. FDAARGOS_221]